MMTTRTLLLALAIALTGAPVLPAAELNCRGEANVEEYRYSWRLRGGIRFIAGLIFPTSGVGNLKTTYPATGGQNISSELLITAKNGPSGGFYAYESEMDAAGRKTLVTYHGYAWGQKSRKERTVFDYVKRLARIHKETPEKVEDRVKKLPGDEAELRDILTAIHFLRQNAPQINGAITTSIYSDGKDYPVMFQPGARQAFTIEGKSTMAREFRIVDAPGGKKWPGGVSVWLSDDARRIPFRITIQQGMASLQLDLQTIEACAFMQASR
jgi:hypothetical protein